MKIIPLFTTPPLQMAEVGEQETISAFVIKKVGHNGFQTGILSH
jgi:hypothetical protein